MFVTLIVLISVGFFQRINLSEAIKEHEKQDAIMDIYRYIEANLKNVTRIIVVEKNYEFRYLPIFTHLKKVKFIEALDRGNSLRPNNYRREIVIVEISHIQTHNIKGCKGLYNNSLLAIVKC